MLTAITLFLVALASYLVGGIPFGYLIARWRGVNIFEQGSGNIGATNVGRVLGWRLGLLVFLLDFAKGAGPVALVLHGLALPELAVGRIDLAVVAGLAAFLGHLFPVYLGFHGGKGVATGAGVVAVLLPMPLLVGLMVWLTVAAGSRYVSLASMSAAAALCLAHFWLAPAPWLSGQRSLSAFCLMVLGLVVLRHHANISRLIRGTENEIKENPTMQQLIKMVHLLTLGLWFGSTVFFTFVVGLSLFGTFDALGQQEPRPAWFPRPALYDKKDEVINGPREQGSRVAGAAVGPMFPTYFLLQGICGFLAIGSAWGWQHSHPQEKVHRWRVTVLLVALLTVVLGWPLEHHVSELRIPRNEATDRYLAASGEQIAAEREAAITARFEFFRWHTCSLLLNFVTIGLVGVALAMGAALPRKAAG
jgi:acyl-phosphate glycerol 3-phosphate acyltransferase